MVVLENAQEFLELCRFYSNKVNYIFCKIQINSIHLFLKNKMPYISVTELLQIIAVYQLLAGSIEICITWQTGLSKPYKMELCFLSESNKFTTKSFQNIWPLLKYELFIYL